VDGLAAEGSYSEGAALLEKERSKFYRKQDRVLYYLDKGMLSHYAGAYADSSDLLEEGDRAIEAAFTRSVTQEIGTYLVNDTTRDYDGEDYEDIYINTFNALNYYHRGNIEDAMVEIRRMNNKIQFLASKYGVIQSSLQQKALEEYPDISSAPVENAVFTDSALSRYLGLLFYRSTGRLDDARIDRDMLKAAFVNSPAVYTYPVPSSVDEELEIPEGKARLNLMVFVGRSPHKEQETLRIPTSLSSYVKIALPVMAYNPSRISRIEAVFNGGERVELELLEDIEAVARETFKSKRNIIYLKTIIRAAVKGATTSALGAASDQTDGTTALVLGILSLGSQVYSEASEQADLRLSRYFPGKAYVGGINLEPGIYSFTVNYYDGNGGIIASFAEKDVPVRKNLLNLKELVCIK
jgi:hypothetical protein